MFEMKANCIMSLLSEKGEATLAAILSLLMLGGMYVLAQTLIAPRRTAEEIPEIEEFPQKTGFGGHFSNVSYGLSYRHWKDKMGIQLVGGFVPDAGSVGGQIIYQVHKGKVSRAYFGLGMGYIHLKEKDYSYYPAKDKITDTFSLAGLFGYEVGMHRKLPILGHLEIGQAYALEKEEIDGVKNSRDEPKIMFGVGAHYYFK